VLRVQILPGLPGTRELQKVQKEKIMAKKRGRKPANYGKKYKLWEIELIFRVKETDKGKRWLGKVLKRNPKAIDFVYRWIEALEKLELGEKVPFPEEAKGNILKLAYEVLKMYGTEAKGTMIIT
jgi:hypothetical protein